MDVVAGILVGITFSVLVLMFFADIFNRPRPFQVKFDQVTNDPEDPQNPSNNTSDVNVSNGGGDRSNL